MSALLVKMPENIKESLSEIAKKQKLSMTAIINLLLSNYLEDYKAYKFVKLMEITNESTRNS